MITRIWHGKTSLENADKYLDFLKDTGIKDYKSTSGNLGVEVWRRKEDKICHFYTISRWDNIDGIKKFAGDDYEKARYYPNDNIFLLELEEYVMHCETFML